MKFNKMTAMRSAGQAGFTLIELIVVIVILGILAATALPKFANLGSDARAASLNAAKGALAATSAMAHGKYLANTSGTPLLNTTFEGQNITFTTPLLTGYPQADNDFGLASGLNPTDYQAVPTNGNNGGANAPDVDVGQIAFVPVSVQGTAAAKTCYVKYAQPNQLNAPPTITIDKGGC